MDKSNQKSLDETPASDHERLDFENVALDSLDGFGFQDFCAHLFEKLKLGTIERTPYTGDEGRDLIIHLKEGGLAIVECKHQPNTSIGRPVVQKLHSAVVSSNAKRGILITTGRFSNEAIEHARKLTPPIELMDRLKLVGLANQARIRLSYAATTSEILAYEYGELQTIQGKLQDRIGLLASSPVKSSQLMQTNIERLDLEAGYLVKYDIHQDFQLAKYLHRLDAKDKLMIIDSDTSVTMSDSAVDFLAQEGNLTVPEKLLIVSCPTIRHNFKLDLTTLRSIAETQIIKQNTQTVSYVGENNVSYSKVCQPSPRSVYIKDVKQVLVPQFTVSSNALKQKYSFSLVATSANCRIVSGNILQCSICRHPLVQDKSLLCNTCGRITDLECHGFICKECGRTICSECSYWRRHNLIFKEIICEPCATKENRLGNKIVSNDIKSRKQEIPTKSSVRPRAYVPSLEGLLITFGVVWLIGGLIVSSMNLGESSEVFAVIGVLFIVGGVIRKLTRYLEKENSRFH